MIKRFRTIIPGKLYRGGAPSVKDVIKLHKLYGIKKIVSLDEESGKRIDRICKLLNIDHQMFPINGNIISVANLLKQDIKHLLLDNGPTFFHCHEGKDRTGFLAAYFKCKYLGWNVEDALKEAKSLGFGIDVDPRLIRRLENILRKLCKSDENNADIVTNERENEPNSQYFAINEFGPSSMAPFMSTTRQYPYTADTVYNYVYHQTPTRQNLKDVEMPDEGRDTVPLVGLYDNTSGVKGVGPVEIGGGFLNI